MHRLRDFLRTRWVVAAAGVVLVVGLGTGGILLAIGGSTPSPTASPAPASTASPTETPSPSPTPSPTASPSPTPAAAARCPWNGLPVSDPTSISSVALSVQIENHPDARPTRNLGAADMVVEITVEGDVTRFSVIFQCRPTVGLTGPVRSGRYYVIDLWQDLHVLPFFFGSQTAELRRYSAAGLPYVNGISGAWPADWFQRYGPKPAPHNLYADLEAARARLGTYAPLDRLASRVGEPRPQFSFDPEVSLPADGRSIASVELRTNAYWRIGWTWDPASGTWLRSDGGAPNVDAVTGDRLAAGTVIVERAVETVDYQHPDPGGNPQREHQLIGHGTGTLYVDGHAYDVRWSRPSASAGTTWTYAGSGDPVVLPPGVVWWEIIPTTATVTER